MRAESSPCDSAGDAWERMADAFLDRRGGADDHGNEERGLLLSHSQRLAAPLTHIPTSSLKSALLTTAVHVFKCGGGSIGVTAADLRIASRADLIRAILSLHERSDDLSQMIAIAIEHAIR